MKILILGGTGMLGHKMHQVLSGGHDVVSTTRGTLAGKPYADGPIFRRGRVVEAIDATDEAAVRRLLTDVDPEVLINCVGIVKQREEAHDPTLSITVNALLPHRLSALCAESGARLIHFSTDCVFSGARGSYLEEDPSDATDLYGRTKYLGEVRENGLTIRTSIIGRELEHFRSLVEWFLRQEGPVHGHTGAVYTGLTTLEMARLVERVVTDHRDLDGLYQVASAPITKCDLLYLIRDAFGLRTQIVPDDEVSCDRSLLGGAFRAATGIEVPPWAQMIEDLAKDASVYRGWGP